MAVSGLVLIVFLAYHEAPENSFHFDDGPNITEYAPVRISVLTLDNLIEAGRDAFLPRRPLASVTFAIDWWRGHGSPRPFLWTNLGIHISASIAVFLLLSTVIKRLDPAEETGSTRQLAAFFGAAIWAVHPIQAQAVVYIVQRMASLSALMTILTVWTYLNWRLKSGLSSYGWLVTSVFSFVAGALTKETAWIAPVLLILAEICIVRRAGSLFARRVELSILGVMSISGLGVVLSALAGVGPLGGVAAGFRIRDFTMWERVLTQPRVLFFHFSQFFWPLPSRFSLSHEFPKSTSFVTPPVTLLAWILLGLWVGVGIMLLVRKRSRVAAFFVLWLPATIALEFSIFNLEMVFEHRMYLPTVGLAGLWSMACWACIRGRFRFAVIAVNAAVIVLLVVSTQQRIPVWRSELSLAQDAVDHNPRDSRALAALGQSLLTEGRLVDAKSALLKSLSINENESTALQMMALIHLDENNLNAAETRLRRAELSKKVGSHSIHNHWGELLLKRGKPVEAQARFRLAIAGAPWVPTSYWNLAVALERTGDCREALRNWETFLKLETIDEKLKQVESHVRETYFTPGGKCLNNLDSPS